MCNMAEKESKKRKRQSNAQATPNKRTATEEANSGQIQVRLSNSDGAQPVLLSTPGLTTPRIAFDAYSKSSSTESPALASDLILHSSEHARIDYTASQASLDQHLSHYIAVYDEASKQLQVIPSHYLELRSTLRPEPKDEAEKAKRTLTQQRADLGQQFGTKKAKKIIADRTVNAIVHNDPGKAGSKAQDLILESMSQSALPNLTGDEQIESELASKPIPKPNLAAKEVKDIYPFDTLIPPDHATLINIKEWQEAGKDDKEIGFQHRYPARRVGPLAKRDEILRLKALRYLTLLLEFHATLTQAGRDGKKVPKKDQLAKKLASWPQQLVDKVRIRFSNPQNELSGWHVQNLRTHACALSLYVDGWTTDTSDLRDALRVENKDVTKYFRELGCKVAGPTEAEAKNVNEWFGVKPMSKEVARSVRIARLKLPLDFPKASRGRRG